MEKRKSPRVVVDVLIIAFAGILLIAASKLGLQTGRAAIKGTGAVLGGIYIIYIGVLFLLSYFFPGRSFVFCLLGYLCEECSRPAGRAMAWLYFGLSVIIGSALSLVGLGVL